MSQFKDVLETATRLFIEDDDSFTVEECVENAILLCREVEEQLDAEVEQGGPDPEPIEYPKGIYEPIDTASYQISCSIDAGDYLRVWENTPPTAMIEIVEKKTVANIGLDKDDAKRLGQWLLSWAAKPAS